MNDRNAMEQTLRAVLAQELSRAGRYFLYARVARAQDLMEIGSVFEECGQNALAHAEIWQKELRRGEPPCTTQCLRDAARGELGQWSQLYDNAQKIALEAGEDALAHRLERAAQVARYQDARFCALGDASAEARLFRREEGSAWRCMACGHWEMGKEAPESCALCGRGRGWFEER